MWTYYRTGIVPKKKKKEDKEILKFPAIPSGPTSLCQVKKNKKQNSSQRPQELFFSSLSDHGPPDKTIRTNKYDLPQHHKADTHNYLWSEYNGSDAVQLLRRPDHFLKDKVSSSILKLTEHARIQEACPHHKSMAELTEEGDNSGDVRKDKDTGQLGLKGDQATSTESGACLSAGSNDESLAETRRNKVPGVMGRGHQLPSDTVADKHQKDEVPRSPPKQKRFMIYICGGYKDTVVERAALMENVYPRLYVYCKQRGYDFKMVDLRLGVGNPLSDRHDTVQLHLETLQQCQATQGPNFILFLGQKYEVQMLPATISTGDFVAIVSVLEREKQRMSRKNPSESTSTTDSQSSIATATSSFVRESIYGNYLNFGETATNSGLMGGNSQTSFSEAEEARASPMSERTWGELDKDLRLLQMWYKLDENCVPPVYRLLPVSTHHPHLLSRDAQRRKEARQDWNATSQHLWGVLQRSGPAALGKEGTSLLLRTVLDWEIDHGLRSLGAHAPAEEHCHCYKRVIPDLYYNLKNEYAVNYVDLLKGQPKVNPALKAAHQRFVELVHSKLRHTNIYERNVGWGRQGLNPKHNRSHEFYSERICSHFQRTVASALNSIMEMTQSKAPFDVVRNRAAKRRVQEEIQRHINYGLTLAEGCTLRRHFLDDVRRAVQEPTSRPILVLGPPGWGKSTTLAGVSQLASSWLPGDVKVLVHFVGLTGESRNIRLVLESLCVQLAEIYSPQSQLSQGLPQLINELHSLLDSVSAERPLVLLLDGVEQLSEEHGPDLAWLSVPLPAHVHLVLSAASGSPPALALQKSADATVLSIPPLSHHDITRALEEKLHAGQRRLPDPQWRLLLQACLSCPSPLYLEAAYWESLPWTSYSPEESLGLPGDLEGLYLRLLARLEEDNGGQLVKRALSLVSLSRGGITDEEMLDLLAKDGKVLQEVASAHSLSSSHPRVPYVLWARLRRDLGPHLTEAETDGTWVYRWAHTELGRVCAKSYLKTEESRMAAHAAYADYFRGGSSSPARADVFQPLAWTLGGEAGEEGGKEGLPRRHVFNLRKLHGLPYHLVRSGQILPFMAECVFNYDFLLHKAWGLSLLDIQEDLKEAVLPDKVLLDVEMLSEALQLSRVVLEHDPCQMASQIMGRLGKIVAEDRPIAPGDPLKFSFLHALLAQCAQSSLPVLVPSYTCLLPPGGLAPTLLAGHSSEVTALGMGKSSSVAVTCEADGTVRFWDLELRRVVRTLREVVVVAADSLALGLDDRMLVVRVKQSLQVREVESGRVVYTDTESGDVPAITTTCEGQLLVAFYNGSHLMKVFDLASSCSLLHCVSVSLESDFIHMNCSVLLSPTCIKDYVLFAYRSGCRAAIFSARSGAVRRVLYAQHGAASIQAVEMSSQYILLFCRYPYKSDGEIIHIELFSTSSFAYLRSILGCGQDCLSQVTVNQAGTHAVAFCSSPRTGLTEVVTWNLETEDHKHIACFPGTLTTGLCLDLRYCVGICSGERYLKLWDLSSRINDQTLTYNVHKQRSDGTAEVIPMGENPRYAVCRSLRAGTVYVWNLTRQRFTGRPVRVEHGLYGSHDVVLARNLKLYILTDRGTSNSTGTPIFQTLLVYDLVKKSYVRRHPGLYIMPCPQHEYKLLEDGRVLLGLSDTRDHVILWDLETGHIRDRIKPLHTESLLSDAVVSQQQLQMPPKEKHMMPWDIRAESHSAKRRRLQREAQRKEVEQRRLDREKYNAIDQYLLSEDEQVIVCSYFAHHLNVFSVASKEHLHTLEDRTSLLTLHTAALTRPGSHLVVANYNQAQHTPYLTLWDLRKGTVQKRLRNEPGVCCVAITGDGHRVAFGVTGSNKLKVWDTFKRKHKSISGYGNLRIGVFSKLYMAEGGAKAILLSGQISLWDLEASSVLSVLSLDAHVQCLAVLGGGVAAGCRLLLGLSHSPALVTVTLTSQAVSTATQFSREQQLFGESSSSEEEEE